MNYTVLTLLVVVVCSIGRTNAGWFSLGSGPDLEGADFASLDSYLMERLVDDQDSGRNLALLKSDINKLPSGGLRKAADIILRLSAVAGTCNENVLSLMRQANEVGLKLIGSSSNRTDKVIGPHLKRILEACIVYVDQSVDNAFNDGLASDKTLGDFFEIVGPPYSRFPGETRDVSKNLWDSLMDNTYNIPTELQLNQFLKKLSKGDKKAQFKQEVLDKTTGQGSVIEHMDKFDYAFDKYLVRPCLRFASSMADPFEKAKLVANMTGQSRLYVADRTAQFRCLAWRNKACRFILHMNEADKATLMTKSW